jgi:FkbH-like protein
MNVRQAPPLNCPESDLPQYVQAECNRYREIWASLETNLNCQIIQNNFEMPPYSLLGNMDAVASGGLTRFLAELNAAFAQEAAARPRLLLQDIHGLSARMGTKQWFDWKRYFSYKILHTAEANLELARSLNAMIKAIYGKSRKVLVLDLDNTLWGGIIGDDGADKIQIGRETAVAEAFTAFQEYCLALRNRGILLAVCSKNDEAIAKSGFEHPSSILKLEHFSGFKANWEPKHDNILAMAKELNLGADSFVFIDDNPAERALVAAQVPGIAVPDVGSDVSHFAEIIAQARYFEAMSLSKEDLERAALYANNRQRSAFEAQFKNYGEYLDSLEMAAEIDAFQPVYLDRITQLTNKTNQFNLTTRRYTLAEMESVLRDPQYISLYGKLSDRFGDHGLISVVVARKELQALHINLWLMSCRVLKRDMELAMLDVLVERALENGVNKIYGYYVPTKKNGMVADFYSKLGFTPAPSADSSSAESTTIWSLDLANYSKRSKHIKVREYKNG